MLDLQTFAGGALAEKLQVELEKVYANIADENTDPKRKRKVTVTLTIQGNEKRDLAEVFLEVKSTLAPMIGTSTDVMIGMQNGKVVGKELRSGIPGQMYIDDQAEVRTDTGEKVDTVNDDKVVQFK